MIYTIHKDKIDLEQLKKLISEDNRIILIGDFTDDEKQLYNSLGIYDIAKDDKETDWLIKEPTSFDKVNIDNSDKTEKKVINEDVNVVTPKTYKKPVKGVIVVVAIFAILAAVLFAYGITAGIIKMPDILGFGSGKKQPEIVEVDKTPSYTPSIPNNSSVVIIEESEAPEDIKDFDSENTIIARSTIYGKWKLVGSFATEDYLKLTYETAYGEDTDPEKEAEWISKHIHNEAYEDEECDYLYIKEKGYYLILYSTAGSHSTRTLFDDEVIANAFGGTDGSDYMLVKLNMYVEDNMLYFETPMCVLVFASTTDFVDSDVFGTWNAVELTYSKDFAREMILKSSGMTEDDLTDSLRKELEDVLNNENLTQSINDLTVSYHEDGRYEETGLTASTYYVINDDKTIAIFMPSADKIVRYNYEVIGDTLILSDKDMMIKYTR